MVMPKPDMRVSKHKKSYRSTTKVTIALLLLILCLAAVLAYYPHINYAFPLSSNEWYNIAIAQNIAETHAIPRTSIYVAGGPSSDTEVGYHIFLAIIYLLFKPSITQWMYLPTILQIFAILSVFFFVYKLFGRNEALVAALLIGLLPTAIDLGGPAFLIPENIGLILIPIALVFAFRLTKIKPMYNYIGMFLTSVLLLYLNATAAIVLIIILAVYALLILFPGSVEDRSRATYILLFIFLAALIAIPNYLSYLQSKGTSPLSFTSQNFIQPVVLTYGVLQTIFFIIGALLLFKNRNKEVLCVLIATIIVAGIKIISVSFNNSSLASLLQDTYVPVFLFISIIASVGYSWLLNMDEVVRRLGTGMFIIAIVITCFISIKNDVTTPYYHLISEKDYQNFLYIKENFNNNTTAIMNPYVAIAFTPITEMHVYSVQPPQLQYPYSVLLINTKVFFESDCSNIKFLQNNNIQIIYTNGTCMNGNITNIYNNTYALKSVSTEFSRSKN